MSPALAIAIRGRRGYVLAVAARIHRAYRWLANSIHRASNEFFFALVELQIEHGIFERFSFFRHNPLCHGNELFEFSDFFTLFYAFFFSEFHAELFTELFAF